jgi:hypothetical protein
MKAGQCALIIVDDKVEFGYGGKLRAGASEDQDKCGSCGTERQGECCSGTKLPPIVPEEFGGNALPLPPRNPIQPNSPSEC